MCDVGYSSRSARSVGVAMTASPTQLGWTTRIFSPGMPWQTTWLIEVQQLFVHFISALGHDPIVHDPGVAPVGIDALIIEPAMNGAAELVESLRALDSDLPIVAVSVYPPSALSARIDWTSFHLKPFGLAVLRDALAAHVPTAAAT